MCRFFEKLGVKLSPREAKTVLLESSYVFCLQDGSFITRAGAFTGEVFSIKPTPQEFSQKLFVPGSRCIPFVDSEMVSSSLTFSVDGFSLPTKVGVFDSDLAIDLFILYGEEYAPQYIASDPANSRDELLENDFELPLNVSLTGIDISYLIEECGMKLGDRILCTVDDWDAGALSVMVLHDGENVFNRGLDGSLRLKWYKKLNDSLLDIFKRLGPCSTMEEQLASAFFENIEDLCVPTCGSIEEYLNWYAKDVGIQHFGVETRLWYKGREVPAVGEWNASILESYNTSLEINGSVFFTIPPEILDLYILDMYFHRKNSLEDLIQTMYPEDYVFHKDEKNAILLQLKLRSEILKRNYNWFRDQVRGPVRERALELFSRVAALVFKVDCSNGNVEKFPQQELVILTQLYSHLLRMLESIADDPSVENEASAMLMSLEGMEWNFEDIQPNLLAALEEQYLNRFKIFN